MKKFLIILIASIIAATSGIAANPDPFVILEKNIAAIGGWEKINAQQSSHTKGTLVIEGSGLEGTLEIWGQLPGKSRQEIDLKVIKQSSGDNGKIAWRVDPNGKLQIANDSATLKERQLGLLMSTREHMKKGTKEFTVTYDRLDTADGITCHVIKTTNTINSFVFFDFYDTSTYRQIKNITIKPNGESHSLSKDYRNVEGVLFPFLIKSVELPVNQATTVTITSIEINIPIDPQLFEPPSEQKKDYRFPAGKTVVEVPCKFIELHIYIPLTINGKTKLWILDSGAGSSVIEKEFADELGLKQEGKITGQGATNTAEFSFVTLPSFELNGLAFDSQKVVALAINESMRKILGMEIGGILGYDFLSRLVTKVDFANQMLTFYEPDSFNYKGNGVILNAPLEKDNMFHIQISIDSQYSGNWALDLGASGMDFNFPYAEEHGLLNHPGVANMGFGAGGGQANTTAQFKTISFAGFTLPKPQVSIPSGKSAGAFGEKEKTGNAGNTLFRHFNLYLDYKNEKVIVEKGADFDKVFPTDHSGLKLMFNNNNQLEVLISPENTPSAKAGIHKGDIVTGFDGKSIEAIGGILAIREMLRAPVGTKYKIDLLRDGKPLTVTMTLKDLYE
jgi:hypothetical protein